MRQPCYRISPLTKLQWAQAGWRGDVLALLAGVLVPLAFAPFNVFPLAVLAPAMLFAVWLFATVRQAFWRGWLFGVGMFGVGVSWVYVAIHDFGNSGIFLAGFLTAGFVAFLALFPALLGYSSARLAAYKENAYPLKLLLLYPAAWVLFEWVRGWILSGFPWLNLGYSQIDSPLAGLAPLVGVYGLSWVCAFSAGLIGMVAVTRRSYQLSSLAMLICLWGGAALLGNVTWTQALGKPLQVAVVQGNIPQQIKWQPEQRQRSLDLYAELTRRQWGKDLIVWPEAALTVFYHQIADTYLAQLAAEARRQRSDLLIGLSVQDQQTEKYYNAMLSLGSKHGFYLKQHLVPFGDYVPFADWLRGLIGFFDLPMSGYSAGPSQQNLLEAAGYKIGASICYEDTFGEEVIRNLPQAALLVNGTNNAWYGDSLAPPQHLQMARMRALETGRAVLRATTNGISAIIDPKGKLVARSPQFETVVLTGTAQPMQGATPYVRWGNYPVLLIVLVSLAVVRLRK